MSLPLEKVAEARLPKTRLLARWPSAMLGLAGSWWPSGNLSLLVPKRWLSHSESPLVPELKVFVGLSNSKTVSDLWRPWLAPLGTMD